jgi:DNA-binding Lrp family transcriptional regulator
MVIAYVMIVTEPGTEKKISSDLKKMDSVKDVGIVYGEYDIIVKVEVSSMLDLQNFILGLRKNKGIQRTTTMISV